MSIYKKPERKEDDEFMCSSVACRTWRPASMESPTKPGKCVLCTGEGRVKTSFLNKDNPEEDRRRVQKTNNDCESEFSNDRSPPKTQSRNRRLSPNPLLRRRQSK